jgi:hypothetical protein
MSEELVPYKVIENKIYLIRGQKVMMDEDLAMLYGVLTKYLNQQVRRNITRFPEDFRFQLTREEAENLRLHFATSSYGGRRYLPFAFTEHGILMLSSVLNSKRAIDVNIQIMRIFVKIREILSAHKDLAHKLDQLEQKVGSHDVDIRQIFNAIRQIMKPTKEKSKKIGFLK